MLIVALTVLLAAAAQTDAKTTTPNGNDIIVVGQRIDGLKAEFDACVAKRCTTEHDAAAALALSQAQFLAGDYRDARRTLATAIGRNADAAREHPLPVAALLRARVRVDSHLGEYADARSGMIRQLIILRRALSSDDPNTIAALVQLGDVNLHVGRTREAESQYRDALARAISVGNRGSEVAVRFRLATLYGGGGLGKPTSEDQRRVADILRPIVTATDETLRRYAVPARLVEARTAERGGASGRVDAVLRALPPGYAQAAPQLLAFKPVNFGPARSSTCLQDFDAPQNLTCQDPRNLISSVNVEKQWIDVSFWITPDGGTRDVEVLRGSSSNQGDWPQQVAKSVGSRRYAPMRPEAGDAGLYRVERYTLTAPYIWVTGTRIPQRSTQTTLETTDITPR